jgi:hypothetical protein
MGARGAFRQRLECLALLPPQGSNPDLLDRSLDLTGRNIDAARFPQRLLGFLVARLVGSLQADQGQERGRLAVFNPKGGVGWIMADFLARMVEVIALENKGTEKTIDRNRLAFFALLPRFGWIRGIDLVRRRLQEESHQRGRGFENGRPDQGL